jgi:hypothetical protein
MPVLNSKHLLFEQHFSSVSRQSWISAAKMLVCQQTYAFSPKNSMLKMMKLLADLNNP